MKKINSDKSSFFNADYYLCIKLARMKKCISIGLLMVSVLVFSQIQQGNRFAEEEGSAQQRLNADQHGVGKDPEVAYSPGNPGSPVPIDQHLPFLLLAATGIMVYVTYRRKSALK